MRRAHSNVQIQINNFRSKQIYHEHSLTMCVMQSTEYDRLTNVFFSWQWLLEAATVMHEPNENDTGLIQISQHNSEQTVQLGQSQTLTQTASTGSSMRHE